MGRTDHCSALESVVRRADAAADLAAAGPVTVTVLGSCMTPRLADGARVRVAPAKRYWPGDIVAYRPEAGGLVLHRALGYRRAQGRWCLVTRGDRDRGADAPVDLERVVGRVQEPTRLGARVVALARFVAWAAAAAVRRAAS